MKCVSSTLTSLGCAQKILASFRLKLESRQILLSIQPRSKSMWENLTQGFQWLSFANAFTQGLPDWASSPPSPTLSWIKWCSPDFAVRYGYHKLLEPGGSLVTSEVCQSLEQWAGLKACPVKWMLSQWSSLKVPLSLGPWGFEQHLGGWQRGERQPQRSAH